MDINGKTIGELAVSVPNAIRVFERLNIDYCCHGNRSVSEACAAVGVTPGELLVAALEQDLHRHIHLENNVLFPRAAEMEAGVRDVVCTY